MKLIKPCRRLAYVIILANFVGPGHPVALAEPQPALRNNNLPLIFDPETHKYFISGSSKFILKEMDQNGIIDRVEVSIDGGDYVAYTKQGVSLTSEGKHVIKFRAVNAVNQRSPEQFTEIFVDMTPPSTELKLSENKVFQNAAGTYTSPEATISLSAEDSLSGVASIEYSWDGTTFSPYSRPLALEESGKRTLYYRSVDRVGNVEPQKTMSFIVDTTPPASSLKILGQSKTILVGGKNYLSANDAVSFAFEATDDASGIRKIYISVDGAPFSEYVKPIFLMHEGPHSLRYYAEDNVGNREKSKDIALYTVSVPPRTVASMIGKVVNTGGINFGTKDFQLRLEAKDNIVGLDRIEVKVDRDSAFRSYIDPLRFGGQGNHTASFRAVDRAGNAEPTRTFSITIQDTPPETHIETAQPLVVRGGITYSPAPNIITLNASNTNVGIEKTLYSLNDSPYQTYRGPITLTANEKVYAISYKSIDKLGNEERPKTATYHMIGTVPVVDLFISNGQNGEEQVRTDFFDQKKEASENSGQSRRSPASTHRAQRKSVPQ